MQYPYTKEIIDFFENIEYPCKTVEIFKGSSIGKTECIINYNMLTESQLKDLYIYEISNHWLASWIWFDWGQDIMASLIVRRVNKKLKRYNKLRVSTINKDGLDALYSIGNEAVNNAKK